MPGALMTSLANQLTNPNQIAFIVFVMSWREREREGEGEDGEEIFCV